MGKSTISMVIFHSYVKLPEGIQNIARNMGRFSNRTLHWILKFPPGGNQI